MIVLSTDPAALDQAETELLANRAVVVPTDTVYGLAALPTEAGLDCLFALKDRPPDRSIAVLVSDPEQVDGIVVPTAKDQALMEAFWPGPLTLVMPRIERAVPYGAADGTVGVRCPADAFMRALARRVGPLAVTSANRSGEPTQTEAGAAALGLAGTVEVVIDGGVRNGIASTVARCRNGEIVVFREGPLSAETLQQVVDGQG